MSNSRNSGLPFTVPPDYVVPTMEESDNEDWVQGPQDETFVERETDESIGNPGPQQMLYPGFVPGFVYLGPSGSSGSSHIQQVHIPPQQPEEPDQDTHTPRPSAKKYYCRVCHKPFDRQTRAQTCEDKHRGMKSHYCGGQCGNPTCTNVYASESSLRRHCLPESERIIPCPDCGLNITRQNVKRHEKNCTGRVSRDQDAE